MIVYRFEAEDGGGPWFHKNGDVRFPLPDEHLYLDTDDYLYGCSSLEALYNYFFQQKISTQNCVVKTYEVPKEEIIFLNKQVKFPKKYAEADN